MFSYLCHSVTKCNKWQMTVLLFSVALTLILLWCKGYHFVSDTTSNQGDHKPVLITLLHGENSITVLFRCNCWMLGCLNPWSLSGISHENDSVPLLRMSPQQQHFPNKWYEVSSCSHISLLMVMNPEQNLATQEVSPNVQEQIGVDTIVSKRLQL